MHHDVGQGPLAGCLTGQGVRWDTVELQDKHELQVHRGSDRAPEDRKHR